MKKVNKILENILRIILVFVVGYKLIIKSYSGFEDIVICFLLTYYDFILEKLNIHITEISKLSLICLIYLASFLGSICHFYDLFSWWDIFLHFSSGIIFYNLGYEFTKTLSVKNSRVFLILFAVFFAISIGAFWEIIEYSIDGILKYDTQVAQSFIGREALKDTMTDMISSTISTTIMAISSFIFYKVHNNKN